MYNPLITPLAGEHIMRRSTLAPREIHPPIRKGARGREVFPWIREWNDRSARLLQLIAAIDGDGLESAAELLQEVRECRRRLIELPEPELRLRWYSTLDEIWEAACSTLYGDLGPARQHADAALGSIHEMREILESWAG
jgi:hypothetical protein